MKKKIFIYLLLANFIYANLLKPENNSILNYTHVLFEWEQVYQADSYNFQLSTDESFSNLLADIIDETTLYIYKIDINWDSSYYWRIRPKFDNESYGDWSNTSSFSTGSSISSAYSINYNDNDYSDGVTIFSSFFNYYSAMIDQQGNEIWNSTDSDIVYYNTDYKGQLLGCYVNNALEHYLPGIEFSLDNEYIWEEPNNHFLHHELIKLPDGNYLGLIEDIQIGPIPYGPWTTLFQALGYQANGFTQEFPWVGDKIVVWDKDTKDIIWEWSTFDYYNMNDYDTISDTWFQAATLGRFDWTHCNALDYDGSWGSDNTEGLFLIDKIYLSSRHLSRISKIDFNTKNIDWNMGLEMPSGDTTLGNDLGFSFQHSLHRPNHSGDCFATLDNGNISEYILDTDYPTTRALWICFSDNGPFISWDYSLPENYFGFASGNVQKLDNDNFLITTVGDGGSVLEIDYQTKEIVWEGKLNLQLPNGAVYRANRIPGLYPIAYSTIIPEMYKENGNNYTNFNSISLKIIDEGDRIDYTNYKIILNFENDNQIINNISLSNSMGNPLNNEILYINNTSNSNYLNIKIIPDNIESLEKNIYIIFNNSSCDVNIDCEGICNGTATLDCNNVCNGNAIEDCFGICNGDATIGGCDNTCGSNAIEDCTGLCDGNATEDECGVCNGNGSSCQNCDEGFTYYGTVPNSTILLDGSYCFSNNDLDALNDIISENSLNIDSPIYLGSQNWVNGRITRLEVGSYYQGGQLSLTTLPESIDQMTQLSVLYANYNQLTQLPDNITNLENLFFLVLSFNEIISLPEQIGNLTNLYWLDIGYNQLESLPESIGNLENLIYLWIFNNNLSYLPNSFCNLNVNWNSDDYSFLPYFGSGGNQLCDNISECIESSPNLNSSIDPLYYSFEITTEQECEISCTTMDLNQDGTINIVDVIATVNIIIGNVNPTDVELCAGDINSDGTINIVDVISIVNYILN